MLWEYLMLSQKVKEKKMNNLKEMNENVKNEEIQKLKCAIPKFMHPVISDLVSSDKIYSIIYIVSKNWTFNIEILKLLYFPMSK